MHIQNSIVHIQTLLSVKFAIVFLIFFFKCIYPFSNLNHPTCYHKNGAGKSMILANRLFMQT